MNFDVRVSLIGHS